MTFHQKLLFKENLLQICECVRTLGAFMPVRYNHPSLNALNDISLSVMKMQAELELENCEDYESK